MKKSLTAALALVVAFNFSCSEDKDERFDYCITADGCLEGSFTASTCKGQLSNSCPNSYSSSSAYESVTISTQVWQKCNLNEAVEGSKCYGDDSTYCDIYGRLYDWVMAMDLPSDCFIQTCTSQINSPHQGICPKGWHIPSVKEWKELENNVGGKSVAGKELKANSTLWNNSGMGTDNHGFSALPGGEYASSMQIYRFQYIGKFGSWWTTESRLTYANFFELCYSSESSDMYEISKGSFHSVRCLKD